MYDLTIIGAGMAGLTAAIYAARAGLDFIVLEQDGWGGGQISSAHAVENYPGLPGISGADLGEAVKEQAEKLGAKVELGTVERVEVRKQDRMQETGEAESRIAECVEPSEQYFELVLDDGEILKTRAVIAATGANPRRLGVVGEEHLLGRGVSYCAICDGAFYADRDVFVIGGGDTAVEDAIYLAGICKSVTLVHRRDIFRAPKTRLDKLKALPNVTIRCKETLHAIVGGEHVSGVELNSAEGVRYYDTDAVFVAVGTEPVTSYLKGLPLEFKDDYVAADETCKTAVDGLYVAGDIRKKPLRQAVTAAADGANAATGVIEYIQGK